MKKFISRNIILLSLVSLFTDIASEMLYPIMPIYLKTIGFSVLLIGILEGFAEALAGLSKGYFGSISDAKAKRLPFVQLGYGLSTLSKPLMGLFIQPIWIFFARSLDRLGKGIRTGARDALLSDESTPETKGRVFGFHRSLDTLGAAIGPCLALLYLYLYPNNYVHLFYWALLPGLISICFTLLIKEKKHQIIIEKKKTNIKDFIPFLKTSPKNYRQLLAPLLLFSILNSSDVFLLLYAKELGMSDAHVIGLYIFYNLIYAIFSYPMGVLADKIGLKNIFLMGVLLFSFVYIGITFSISIFMLIPLFFIYGIYAASTEGIMKAWISNLSPKHAVATGIGTFAALQSMGTLIASILAGFLWYQFGPNTTFLTTGIGALIVFLWIRKLNFVL